MNKKYFAVRLNPSRPDFAQTMTEEEKSIMQQHAAHWKNYMDQGKVVVFGPVLDPTTVYGFGILVVDDERDSRQLVARILESCGADVATAASYEEALEAIGKRRPDVLISDLGMPDHDGYELIRAVRMLPADAGGSVPAAALSAFARSEDRRRAVMAGFQTHVAKPVEPPELIAIVASLAGRLGRSKG